MKKFTKIMSVTLALVMVISAMPILASAETITKTSGVINFDGVADSETGTVDYGNFIKSAWPTLKVKDEALQMQSGGTADGYILGAALNGTKKYGIYTYKFKFKTSGDITVYLDNAANSESRGNRLSIGTLQSKGNMWIPSVSTTLSHTNGEAYSDLEIKVDLFNKKVTVTLDGSKVAYPNINFTAEHAKYLAFRGAGSPFYIDDVSVSYTNATESKNITYTFAEDETVSGNYLKTYGDAALEYTTDATTGSRCLYKNGAYFPYLATGWSGSTGVMTYEFDVKATAGVRMFFHSDVDQNREFGELAGANVIHKNISNGDGTYTTYTATGIAKNGDWNHMKIVIDLDNDIIEIYCNGTLVKEGVSTRTEMQGSEFTLGLRKWDANSALSIDNLSATLAAKAPAMTIAGNPSIKDTTTLEAFGEATELTVYVPVTSTYPYDEAFEDYIDATYIVALYDGTGLVDCTTGAVTGTATANTTSNAETTISDVSFKTDKTYTSVKVFVWNSLAGLKPLSGVGEINE